MPKLKYKLDRIERLGYKVVHLGKNIRATKNKEVYHGKITKVFREIFGY